MNLVITFWTESRGARLADEGRSRRHEDPARPVMRRARTTSDIRVGSTIPGLRFCGSRHTRSPAHKDSLTIRARITRHVVCSRAGIVFSRFTACLLIALVALPFTTPFSTCDLSMLMSAASHASSRAAIGHGGRSRTPRRRYWTKSSSRTRCRRRWSPSPLRPRASGPLPGPCTAPPLTASHSSPFACSPLRRRRSDWDACRGDTRNGFVHPIQRRAAS
jgi:hypothetical protein